MSKEKGKTQNKKRKLTRQEKKQIDALIRQSKGDGKPHTAQDSIPFERMYKDGICRLANGRYSKCIEFEDINYQLAQPDDKTAVFEALCDMYNSFDASIGVQLSLISRHANKDDFKSSITIAPQNDDFDSIRAEYTEMLQTQLERGNNGLIKTMSSLGNRPDLFPQSGYVSKYYENPPADYEVPAALLGSDEKFARLMEEADKYVGFPYVWGGSTPETSFDCSGFVSYVLTNSGLYNTGRLGAQGLYNISTPVSNPQPGDLVFFTGTYDTPGVSHVGIYVGEDGDGSPVMLHCGDPIQYSKLDTSYWQSHFYAYGRLNYN